jgi:uncharacterized tellurite resistance protein B-like protein
MEVWMSGTKVIMALAKVLIAAAWADGKVNTDEINCLKDLLFQLPGMTASDWSELDIYIETPVGEAERTRLVAELLSSLKTEADKAQALAVIDALAGADGETTPEEQAAVEEIRSAIQEANFGVFGKMGKFLGNSLDRRSRAVVNAPNRELYMEDFVKNKIYYSVSRRLELEGKTIDLVDGELKKLSLAGGLMARVAYVDRQVLSGEVAEMVEAIERHWQVSEVEANLVADVAVSEIGKGLDYYRLSREFFECTSEEERQRFLDVLFAVAASDGRVSNDEIEEIRTIAIMQKLTHKQFIEAKLRISAERRGNL